MNLSSILHRQIPLEAWAEGEKIPWNDPDFSRRMLREHLSQAHDSASRRLELIERHVQWIHDHLLDARPGRILDLGCGPGLYLNRMAQRGHSGLGIDFSPASIAYAHQTAGEGTVEFREADLRLTDFGEAYDLVMFIYGELNVFRPPDAQNILDRAYAALKPGGKLLIEVSTYESVQQTGSEPPSWFTSEQGLFSDQPHLVLSESFWDAGQSIASERFFVIDVETGAVSRMAASTQAYTDERYRRMLEQAGFVDIAFHSNLGGEAGERGNFFPITAVKSNTYEPSAASPSL